MILSIYKVIEEDTGRTFYDLELNNFICALGTEHGLSSAITDIEASGIVTSLLFQELVSLPTFYANNTINYSTIFITSFEFLDSNDLQNQLRSVIESNHPELFI